MTEPVLPNAARLSLRVGWSQLPREARDTLFQLGVIAWIIVPHLNHLAWWCGTLTAILLFWRAYLAITNAPLPGRWPLIVLLVIASGLTWWTERTLFGKQPGVTLLVVLMGLKTLELRGRRDALVTFFLGFFLVLTHCLFSQSLLTALAMAVATWGLLTAQVLASMPVGRPTLRRAGGIAARSALLGLPLMALLFVLFPRIGPLWGLPQDGLGQTGLSGTLRLGGVAEVANDDSIAFRIRFFGPPPASQSFYFRGPVLSQFDGVEWRQQPRIPNMPRQRAELRLQGSSHRYEMLMEPIRLPLLPMLEATPDLPDSAPKIKDWPLRLAADMQWQTDRLITDRLRLQAEAWPRFELGPREMLDGAFELSSLPSGSSPRAVAWAQALKADPRYARADANTLALALMQHIRRDGFSYTLAPGDYGREAIDEFWFDRKQGFCEHFATAFVVMMRAMGVPARVVTGYQGAEAPDADGWMIVRQSNAHAWAEYWQPGSGWRRADPTAAVAPDRVSLGRSLPRRAGLVAGALTSVNPALAEQLRRAWELLDNRWNQWVMNYSRTRQFDLLETLGFSAPSWQDLAMTLIGLLSTLSLGGAAWAWWDRHRQDPWLRLHKQICDTLGSLGIAAQPHNPPHTLAQRVRVQLGAAGNNLAETLEALDRLRYGPSNRRLPGPAWRRSFAREARLMRRRGPCTAQAGTAQPG